MSFWQDRALPFLHNARDAWRRTPIEVALGLLLAMTLSWAIADGSSDAGKTTFKVFAAGYLALVATFGVSALHAFRALQDRTRWLLHAAYLGAAALYGALVLNADLETELWRFAALALAATMGFAVLPAAISWRARDEREAFWHFNARALGQVASVFGYLGALYVGLALGLAAINNLFELRLDGELWGHMFAWVVVALSPWLTAAALPALTSDAPTLTTQVRAGISLLATYLILPLISLYMLILYAYQLKVAASGFELPKNVMSFLTLGAAILLLIGMFLGDQLRRTEEGQGIFIRAVERLPAAFIPLLPMGLWAVLIRVHQHGWTEFRYARVLSLICLIVIFSLSAWRLLRRQQQPLAATFATFGIAGVIAAVGPLSMTQVARKSQLARFEATAAALNMLGPDGKLRRLDAPIQITEDHNPQEQISYLVKAHGHAAVQHLYPDEVLKDISSNRNPYLAANHLNWSHNLKQIDQKLHSVYISDDNQHTEATAIPQGARALVRLDLHRSYSPSEEPSPRSDLHKNTLRLVLPDDRRATLDLSPLAARRWSEAQQTARDADVGHVNANLGADKEPIPLTDTQGATLGWLLLESIQLYDDNGPTIQRISGHVFLP